ncbi:hypothetical protein EVAR_85717_1 [Eumeta japonica]|uniref:Reverse transcriptase domain-containing protein n=1 Tax=Eumeta variegata TaxID=151549 RepID=A0A4C1Y5W9_EUMVA|nr:hypothetical protein EVAR_85717_1 [Eumeta japonica]
MRQRIHRKYIRILKNIDGKSTAQIKLERTGVKFPIEKGVRQGDPIATKIFSAVLERIRRLDWDNYGLNVNGVELNHLRFVDDFILFSKGPKILEKILQQLSDKSANADLSMNITKTKIMSNSSQKEDIKNGIESSVLGVKRRDRIQLKSITGKTKFEKVQTVCRKLKWRWAGHMMKEKKEKWTKTITKWHPRENRKREGRQVKR